MRILLIVFAVTQILLGLLLWITPELFFDELGPFGERNNHYMGDLATFYLALGITGLLAVDRRSWRVPVLTLAVIAYALHSLNHLIDVGDADPSWLGPVDLAAIFLSTLLLGWMLRQEQVVAR